MNDESAAFRKIVGARYKLFRLLLGKSMAEFARDIGVSEPALASFETGRRMLSIERQHAIAYLFGTTRAAIVPEEKDDRRARLKPLSQAEERALDLRVGHRTTPVAYRELEKALKRLGVHDARNVTYAPRDRAAESPPDPSPPTPRKKNA